MLIRALGLALAAAGLAAGAAAPSCSLVARVVASRAPPAATPPRICSSTWTAMPRATSSTASLDMQGVTCEKGGVTFVIDLSEFADADSAYGMFCRESRSAAALERRSAPAGRFVPRRATFVKGKYYLEIAANPEGDHSAALQQWTAALEKTVEGSTEPPAALSLVSEGETAVAAAGPGERARHPRPEARLSGAVRLRKGVCGAGRIAGERGAAVMQKLKARFAEATPAKIGEESFQANDRYLGRLCMFRKGRYVGGYANVAEGSDDAALAAALAAKLK